jgi:hypothetical protein
MALDYGMILNQPSASSQIQQGIGSFMQIREMEAQAKMREQAQMQAQAQAERQGMFQQAFGQAFQSGDRKQLAALMGEFPDQYEQIKGALGFQDEQKATALGSLGVQLSQFAATDPQAAANLIAQNADVLRSAGPGYEPEALLQTLQQDPAALADRADKFSLLALGPEKYFDVTGARAKIDAQLSGQAVQMRAQDIQQQEGAANRANAMSMKQLTLMDKKLDREVQRLGQAAASETNELRRQELDLKVQEKREELERVRSERVEQKEKQGRVVSEALQLTQDLLKDPSLSNAVGTATTAIPTLSGRTQDIVNKATALQAMLTAENLKLMTGVLSETDLALLKALSSGLNITENGIKGSLEGVTQRLNRIQEKLIAAQAKFQGGSSGAQPTAPSQAAAPQAAPDVDALLNKYAPR